MASHEFRTPLSTVLSSASLLSNYKTIGYTTESLIRTLSDFKSEKLIEIKEGKIRILDLNKLKNLLY